MLHVLIVRPKEMRIERERFIDILQEACKRPGLYTGSSSYAAFAHWLNGFDMGCWFSGGRSPLRLGDFSNWLSLRYLIFGSAWSWQSLILHIADSEEDALPLLAQLYREFSDEADSLDSEELYTELRECLIKAYGQDYHNPCTRVTQQLTIDQNQSSDQTK